MVESLTFWRTLSSSSLSLKLGFPRVIPLRNGRRPKILNLNLIKSWILQIFKYVKEAKMHARNGFMIEIENMSDVRSGIDAGIPMLGH